MSYTTSHRSPVFLFDCCLSWNMLCGMDLAKTLLKQLLGVLMEVNCRWELSMFQEGARAMCTRVCHGSLRMPLEAKQLAFSFMRQVGLHTQRYYPFLQLVDYI